MKRESMSKNEVLSFLAAIKYFEHEDGYCHFVKSKICKLIGSIKNGEALTKSLNYLEENGYISNHTVNGYLLRYKLIKDVKCYSFMIDTRFSRCVRGFLYLLKESNPDLNVRLGPKYVSRLLSIDEKSASYYLCSIRKVVDFDQLIKSDSVVSFNPEEFTDCTYTEGLYIPAKLVKEKKCCYCGCSTRSMFEEHCYNVCQKCMHSHGSIKFLEGIIPRLYGNSKQSARSRSLSHSLTKEYIFNLLNSQGGRCAYTGREFDLTIKDLCPSIDRIDSSIGYEEGNVAIVLTCVNLAKRDMSLDLFIDICRDISKLHFNPII